METFFGIKLSRKAEREIKTQDEKIQNSFHSLTAHKIKFNWLRYDTSTETWPMTKIQSKFEFNFWNLIYLFLNNPKEGNTFVSQPDCLVPPDFPGPAVWVWYWCSGRFFSRYLAKLGKSDSSVLWGGPDSDIQSYPGLSEEPWQI